MEQDRFDLEGELRGSRPEPRADFATAVAGKVREASGQARRSRTGLMIALTGLVIVAVASFGGIGYASTQKPTSAQDEYDLYTPPTTQNTTKKQIVNKVVVAKKKVVKKHVAKKKVVKKVVKKHIAKKTPVTKSVAGATQQIAPKVTKAQLPFTGLALWVPLAIGLTLIFFGVALRTKGRRRGPAAH